MAEVVDASSPQPPGIGHGNDIYSLTELTEGTEKNLMADIMPGDGDSLKAPALVRGGPYKTDRDQCGRPLEPKK